ncbi:hypothetical protein H4684_004131 [Desulfomicrobium macestii]|uniref:Uncharacterized protein n=2 Tax=Desulfomicrobium TaxID=898 RepID=A0A8G2C2Q5_DESNO|nr:hypothetical protein [Desulfomicrobium macestii]SFL70629.1 hypothetical protein SAMN05421830_10574 [Desulfomicrobium norvegicum]
MEKGEDSSVMVYLNGLGLCSIAYAMSLELDGLHEYEDASR